MTPPYEQPPTPEIRPATPADYPAVAAIYNTYIRKGTITMDETLKSAADIAAWTEKFTAREGLYVMEQATEILGWGIIKRYSDREGYRFACEAPVYLAAAQTGKGYGPRFKQHLIDLCAGMDYRHVVSKILDGNAASIRYHERLGFEIVGRQRNIGFKKGQGVDVIILQYLIDE